MSASLVQLNWSGVTLTPTITGSAIALTRVSSVMFSQGGELIEYAGDNNRYPVIIANNMNRPRCSITTADVATIMGILAGTGFTITADQLDAIGAAGGAINWQMVNAIHENSEDTGAFSQFASGTCTFRAYSPDGTTPPLTIASRT